MINLLKKFNSDVDLPLEKTLQMHDIPKVIKSDFNLTSRIF